MHGGELYASVIFLAVFVAVAAGVGTIVLLVKLVDLFYRWRDRRQDRRSWILPQRRQ
jgi:hypothetical protein